MLLIVNCKEMTYIVPRGRRLLEVPICPALLHRRAPVTDG